MRHHVSNISNNTSFEANENETILQAALRHGHLYPYGCQAGVCGTCKSKIISGNVKHLSRDAKVLTDDELANGIILCCQAVPQEDVQIKVKEIAKIKEIEIMTMPTRVREKNLLADDVVQLFLSISKTKRFDFLPGQYINILLNNGKERSFSIANTPKQAQKNGLELHIRVVPDGFYSPQVKNNVTVKDIVRIQGPFGTYFLRKDASNEIIMIAGGTGFAPIKGLIEDAIESGFKQPITLYWGVRDQDDLYLDSLAQKWAKTMTNFKYIPVLSNVGGNSDWTGQTGFVHEAVVKHHTDLSNNSVYASGPPVMIDALKKVLPTTGLSQNSFYTDSFDYATQNETS